jgi:hypothetical protein
MFTRPLRFFVNGVALTTVAAIALTHPTSAQARRRVEIAPAVGAFVPSGGVPIPWDPGCPDYCTSPSLSETRTVAVGGRVTAWLGKHGAVEASIFYGPSGVADLSDYTGQRPNTYSEFQVKGNVVLTSLRAVLNVAAPVPTASVLLMAGPAVIHQFGGGWPDWNSPTWYGGVVGIGLDVHRGHALLFRAAIEDYVYRFDNRVVGPSLLVNIHDYYTYSWNAHMHSDFVVSLSTGLSLSRTRTPSPSASY